MISREICQIMVIMIQVLLHLNFLRLLFNSCGNRLERIWSVGKLNLTWWCFCVAEHVIRYWNAVSQCFLMLYI